MTGVWLSTFLATLFAVAVVMLALGLGLLLGRRPPMGSCAGAGACVCDRGRGPC